ncbi:MAG TPA: CRISPR system precrRNA processing endoribonuclease RAMP protein Cas6 [Thermoanaerobaculia bacterium]|nr:CRISPR system precrRNA processing endoribonuclease RAMP protein Cas6 [Thermoanaerobaculia bacterium]
MSSTPMPGDPTTPYPLPPIPYLRLSLVLRALAPARLPPYKGSMLRGAFGHALRRTVCAMGPEQPCESCRLRQACVYPRIFETFIEGAPPPFLRGLSSAPRPYVFEPGDDDRQDFAAGDPLAFDLLLIGQAVDLQAYVLLAVERMARSGLGVARSPFELARAEFRASDGAVHSLFENGRATGPAAPPSFPTRDGLDAERLTIRLLTPLRFKERGHLSTTLDFRSLVLAMVRRTLELAWFHVPGAAIDWTFRPLLDRAATLRSTPNLAWHDWDRYSNRQQRKVTLGGLLGTLHLEGDLTPFAPLLRTAEILHVGKGTTVGLGRIAID